MRLALAASGWRRTSGRRQQAACTHLNILPTVLEMIAPKGFSYYSLYPSLTQPQPDGLVTPKQWITPAELGETASGLVEPVKEADR